MNNSYGLSKNEPKPITSHSFDYFRKIVGLLLDRFRKPKVEVSELERTVALLKLNANFVTRNFLRVESVVGGKPVYAPNYKNILKVMFSILIFLLGYYYIEHPPVLPFIM